MCLHTKVIINQTFLKDWKKTIHILFEKLMNCLSSRNIHSLYVTETIIIECITSWEIHVFVFVYTWKCKIKDYHKLHRCLNVSKWELFFLGTVNKEKNARKIYQSNSDRNTDNVVLFIFYNFFTPFLCQTKCMKH